MNLCNDPDHGVINAERAESRGLRKAWVELDDKRQILERELTAVTKERDEARFDLDFSRRLADWQSKQMAQYAGTNAGLNIDLHLAKQDIVELTEQLAAITEVLQSPTKVEADMIEGRGRTEDDDTGKAMAKLIRQRDEARAEMIRWMSIAEGRGHTDETLSNQ